MYVWAAVTQLYVITCSKRSSSRVYRNEFVGENAALPVLLWTFAQSPCRYPLPSRFRSVTVRYAGCSAA